MGEPTWLTDAEWGYSRRLPGDMPAGVGLIREPTEVHDIEDLDDLLDGPHGNAVAKRVAWALSAVKGMPTAALEPGLLVTLRDTLADLSRACQAAGPGAEEAMTATLARAEALLVRLDPKS